MWNVMTPWSSTVIQKYMPTLLLVEIGPEGGLRHNSPLSAPHSSEVEQPEAPLGDERRDYGPATTFATLLTLHFTLYFYLEYPYYYKIVKEKTKYLTSRKPKTKLVPSVLSFYYCVSVLLQGAHYL
jgi:hypothetical protein